MIINCGSIQFILGIQHGYILHIKQSYWRHSEDKTHNITANNRKSQVSVLPTCTQVNIGTLWPKQADVQSN